MNRLSSTCDLPGDAVRPYGFGAISGRNGTTFPVRAPEDAPALLPRQLTHLPRYEPQMPLIKELVGMKRWHVSNRDDIELNPESK